jgi:large subunit ribosomal protein L1
LVIYLVTWEFGLVRRTFAPRQAEKFMTKIVKRLKAASEKYNAQQVYPLAEAVELAKSLAPVKFDAAIELHVRLGIDASKGEQTVRSSVSLPHGSGKQVRVVAFVTPAQEAEAREAGADVVGGQELIDEIKNGGKFTADVVVATPDMMRNMAAIAKTLGQRGLMPNPKAGTVTPDIGKAVRELKAGRVAFKNDDGGNVHLAVGRVSFSAENLAANIEAALAAIKAAKPSAGLKGTYIVAVHLASTMGPGIRVKV